MIKMKPKNKPIMVSKETHKNLTLMRDFGGFKSIDDVLKKLLNEMEVKK